MLRFFRKADLGSRLAALQRQLESDCPQERRDWLAAEFDRLQTDRPGPVGAGRCFPGLESDEIRRTQAVGTPGKLRVCILTADIAGPIRSGGIGTAFAHLARMLADDGHEVTISFVHPKAPERQWIDRYATDGIRLVHVRPNGGAANQAIAAYGWLRRQPPFDLVHVSEWHGLGAFAMEAKRLGLAFRATHFSVKASSPTLWNEEGNGQALANEQQLAFAMLERRSAVLADTLISGSQHMLRWMDARAYALDGSRSCVQPNAFLMPLRAVKRRDFVPDEFVFFGRLEPRKGLPLFCDAIDRLAKRACVLPRITFLGGAARRFDGPGYIQKRSGLWDCDVSVLSQMGPDEAMAYLRGGKRLSVIPSLLENSSMAVMECLAQGIPFISCATGGTPELIRPEDRRLALCAPSAESLAGMLEKVLGNGAGSVRSSYELQGSNDVWRRWHRSLPRPLRCVQRVGTESAVFIKDKAARVDASVEQRFRSAMSCSAADIVTSFYRVCRPWRSRDVICLGDLITGELSNDGVAGPCCLISREAADVLDVDLQRPDFAKLYRRALLAGFDLDMVPEVLFEVRRWR